LSDPDDPLLAPGTAGFGKRPAADQESYTVMDDDYYDAFAFQFDSRDSTRHGLGPRQRARIPVVEPQAGNVIFWHYDITKKGRRTTTTTSSLACT
jgi:hypothetical protein